ncbi:MAG: hypothetical protein GC168_01440 [Candidatus Hydrogenedens sp.]|nr:hypothetical protein [Candidatus Hydrogenedens sp.]
MAFKVEVAVDETFDTECPTQTVFEILADVPYSVSHFPKVDELHDEGDGVYRWEMEKIGVQSYYLQTVYACKYVSDATKNTVTWTPVKGVGNATVSGKWTLKELKDGGTRVKLSTKGELEMPFPSLAKILLGGFIRTEFESMIGTYIENLQDTFAKGKKPPAKKAAAKKKPAAKKK